MELPDVQLSIEEVKLIAASGVEVPDIEMHKLPKNPAKIVRREGIHQRVRAEILHKDQDAEIQV